MRTEEITLNDKKRSQPSPFLGWVRVVGQNKIDIINFRTGQQHIVEDYNKQVYAFLPVRKGDEVYIEGNFLWGRFYEMTEGNKRMNEIEKMYGNVGINICSRDKGFTLKDCADRDCKECGYYNMSPFTAEKQLELIKFLLNQGVYYSTYLNDTYQFHISDDIENPQPRKFDIAIAEIINDLWQDLTEEERKQIADILKG